MFNPSVVELRPCPFCGYGHPLLYVDQCEDIRIKCPNCQIEFTRDFYQHRGDLGKTRTVDAWNRRAGMLVDIKKLTTPVKPKAGSTLRNMKKYELIEYIRILEHNYTAAVWFNENQARYIEKLGLPQLPKQEG